MDLPVIRVLLIDDSPSDVLLILEHLAESRDVRFQVESVGRLSEANPRLEAGDAHVVLTDLGLPESNGIETFHRVNAKAPNLPIVVLTDLDDETVAVEAVHAGAQDYIVKGEMNTIVLTRALRYSIERKRVQLELRKARDEAEAASRAKSTFLTTMSHEIRTPMNAIIGMSELLLHEDPTDKQREYLEMVLQSAESLLGIINEVLDFSKIEAGKITLVVSCFDLVQLLQDTVKALAVRAGQRDLTLRCDIQDEVPHFIIGDLHRLRQILVNLIGNSLKFTEKGEIALTVSIDSQDVDRCKLLFAISDTGIGIPADKHDVLFEAFEQVENSMSRRYGGTGLGLAICQRLVKSMQGAIWFESELGEGTTFFFTACFDLPDDETVQQAKDSHASLVLQRSADTPLPAPSRRLKVLLAEDSLVNQKLAIALLTRFGHEIVVANNGREAIEISQANRFDLILMDVQMPEVDGFEATRTIRQREQQSGGHVPIIALTAHAMAGDRELCLTMGMDSYLSKPMRAHELYEAVERLLGNAPAVAEPAVEEPVSQPQSECVDWPAALDAVQHDPDLLQELITIFLDEGPKYFDQAQQSLIDGDGEAFQLAAHTLKGSARLFGASSLMNVCQELEDLARTDDLETAKPRMEQLQDSLAEVVEAMKSYDSQSG